MKRRDQLLQQLQQNPEKLIAQALETEERLAQRERQLIEKQQELTIALAQIEELKRQLFGAKADKLSPEQEEQLAQIMGDLDEQGQREPPVSQDVLVDEDEPPTDPEGK